MIISLWLAGIVGCVVLWLLGYVRFLRKLPAGQPVDAAWLDQWRELLTQHGVRGAIPLRVTGDLGPLLCRRLRGYELLVPATLWRDLTQSQRAAILRHELAHYRRADVWKSLAVRVLALPQWFNPLAWLAVRRFDEAAEWACDQAATVGQPRATDYARALVQLGEAATRQASYRPAAHGRTLAVRVRRLLSSGTLEDSVMKKTLLIAAAAALVAVGLVRLELVAREPAVENTLSTDADDTASTAAPAQSSEADARKKPAVSVEQMIPDRQTVGETANVKIKIKNTGEVPLTQVTISVDPTKSVEPTMATRGHQSVGDQLVWKLEELDVGKTVDLRVAYHCLLPGKQQIHVLRVSSAEGELAVNEGYILIEAPTTNPLSAGEGPAKTIRNDLVVQALVNAPDVTTSKVTKQDYRAAAEAAGKAFEAFKAAYETDMVTMADVCNWSVRWLDSERKAANTSKEEIAAVEAYLARMQQLHDKVKALHGAGARGGEAEKYYSMVFYLEEAKGMLKTARQRAKTEDAKPATVPGDAKSVDQNAGTRDAFIAFDIAVAERFAEMNKQVTNLQAAIAEAESKSKDSTAAQQLRAQLRRLQEDFTRFSREANESRKKLGKDPRELRFDGRSFDQWREELLTELKPERRTEAILAFRSFAVNGYGREAAQAIVEVMRGHSVWMIDNSPEGRLKSTALEAFATIDRADAMPVLLDALKDGNANQRLFAASVFQQKLPRAAEAAPALIAAIVDKDAHVRETAIKALAHFDPRPDGLVPELRKALKDENADVVVAAIRGLVPPQEDFGAGGGGFAFRTQRFGPAGQRNQQAPERVGPEPIFVPEFLELLQHTDDQVRQATVLAIDALGPKCQPALPMALEWLHGDNRERRFVATHVLYHIGPAAKQAVPELIKIIDDSKRDAEETVSAIEVLSAIGPAANEAIPAIEKAIKRLPPPGKVGFEPNIWRDRAQQALDKIRTPAESPKAKDAPDPNVQSSANDRSAQPQRVAALIQVKSAPGTPLTSQRPDPLEVKAFRATQIEHIKGPTVLRRALREPGIAQLAIVREQADPVAWLQKNLVAQYEDDSEILRVQLAGGPADEAAKLVNAVVKAYFDENVHEAGAQRKAERDKLQAAVAEREATIAKLRTQKANLAKALGIDENGQDIQIQLLFNDVVTRRNQVTTLSTAISTTELKVLDLETRLRIEKDPVKKEAYIARELAADRRLQELKAVYDAQESEAVDEEKRTKSPNAGKRLRERMKETEQAIVKRKSKIEEELSGSILDSKAADLQGKLEVAKKEREIYEAQLKSAKVGLEKRETELKNMKVAAVDIDNLRETLKQHEALRAKMFAALEAKKIEADAPPRIILLEDAQLPTAKAKDGAAPMPPQPNGRFGN